MIKMEEWDGGEFTVRDRQVGKIDRTKLNIEGKTCPICGKEILSVGYMGEPDDTDVTGFVVHSFKMVQHFMGESKQSDEKCFLTDEDFMKIINND